MLEDVIRLGEAAGVEADAHELRGELEGRLATVRAAVGGATRPRVIALEWLDPPFVGGHWIPEMVSIAGGEDVAGPPGLKSPEVGWGALSGLDPDVVVAMPCGWYVEDSIAQALEHWERIEGLGAGQGLRGRRRLDLLAARPAAGRRGRAARPPAPPRPRPTRRATSASPRCGRPQARPRLATARRALRRSRSRRRSRSTRDERSSPTSSSGEAVAARASPARRRASAARRATPPTSPPRWPPTLMPG